MSERVPVDEAVCRTRKRFREENERKEEEVEEEEEGGEDAEEEEEEEEEDEDEVEEENDEDEEKAGGKFDGMRRGSDEREITCGTLLPFESPSLLSGPATAAVAETANAETDPERPHACQWPACGKRYPKVKQLNRHMASHTGETRHRCTWPGCSSAFFRSEHLKRHVMSHTKQKDHVCSECGAAFGERHHLRRHEQLHLDPTPHGCAEPGCTERFAKAVQLRVHRMRIHGGDLAYSCSEGDCQHVFFSSKAELKKHRRKVHQPKSHMCSDCPAQFARFTELRLHVDSDHARSHECSECGKRFSTARGLVDHSKLHDPDRRALQCPVPDCGKEFFSASGLQHHRTVVHGGGGKRFECPECQDRFTTKASMQRHQHLHDPDHEGELERKRAERAVGAKFVALTGSEYSQPRAKRSRSDEARDDANAFKSVGDDAVLAVGVVVAENADVVAGEPGAVVGLVLPSFSEP